MNYERPLVAVSQFRMFVLPRLIPVNLVSLMGRNVFCIVTSSIILYGFKGEKSFHLLEFAEGVLSTGSNTLTLGLNGSVLGAGASRYLQL
jgi:hypothetical protein